MSDAEQPLIRVQARIEDAGLLADNGRYEGALLMLLVAVAATSRKRYPRGTPSKKHPSKKMGDREAFQTFVRDEVWRLVKEYKDFVVFRGKQRPIEEFLYEFLRNELIHEGGTPVDLHPLHDGAVLTINYADGSGISFTPLLLTRLNDVVWRAPENSYAAVKPEVDAIKLRRANVCRSGNLKVDRRGADS
jgi:hypothetical protein